MQFVSVPELGVPNAPPLTRFPDAVPVNAPTKVVAVTVPTTCSGVVGEVVPMPTLPAEVILIRSVGEDAPSAVVENTRRPGMSFAPGVPST